MDKPFYVTDGMNKIGPFSKEEVLHMLYNAHISIMDYIVDSRDGRMCPLLQHEDFGGEGSTHAFVGGGGIAGLTPENLSNKYGFGELRKQVHKELEGKKGQIKKASEVQKTSHLQRIQDAVDANKPGAPTDDEPTVFGELTKALNTVDQQSTTTTLKTNNSLNFYVKVKDREYGPLKFLILLSLLKQNKLTGEANTRSENETEWRKLSDYLPKELQQTIKVTPILNSTVLPKNLWKRKNVRVDYEEMVLFNNSRYSLVGKSIDLSAEGIAVVWVYDIPINEEFDLSLFDLDKNMVTVRGRLTRKEPISQETGVPFFKAVFIFKEKIQIKQFIA